MSTKHKTKTTRKPFRNKIRKIVKRSGRTVPFQNDKVTQAVNKAFLATEEGTAKDAKLVSDKVVRLLNKNYKPGYVPHIEEIQDLVEKVLMTLDFEETAKSYILYREQRRKMRATKNSLKEALNLIDTYINQNDWRVKENSNMDFSLQGLNNHIFSVVSSQYWINRVYTPEIRKAHEEGDFHLHDLQLIAAYCCGWDLHDLLVKGFGGVPGKVTSAPPKHFRSALGQMVNFIYTLQGEANGAQAFANFDTLLAPFVRFDKLNYKEIKQAIQEFIFNMNVPTRVGFQTPFSNITLDLQVPKNYKDEAVIIGGKPQKEKYGEFQKEMNLINKAFAEVMTEGDADHRVFTFPIPTYNITKDFNWADPALKPVWKMTAKYGMPYFANFVNSDMSPDDARSMCPLGGEEKVLIKSTRGRILEYAKIRNVYEGRDKRKRDEYEIYSEGEFVKGKFNKFSNQKMLKITLENNHELRMTTEHLNFVLENNKSPERVIKGKDLKKGMYLPYSLKSYSGEGGNKDLGFFVGAYAGDGSLDKDSGVIFSLENYHKKSLIGELKKIAKKYFGAESVVFRHEKTKLVTLRVNSQAAVGICRDYVAEKERSKHYKARLFATSLEFRKGVLAGHYATDGGNRHRIYTSSPKMVETLNMLAATLGTTTSIYKDDREGRLGTEPNYAVLVYQLNRKNYGDIWFKKKDRLWVKIKSIKKITNNSAYCFEVKSGKPVFTIGTTGILTHNCRLRLDNRELHKRGGGLFGANPLTGSIGVVTINMPRIGYLSKNKRDFLQRLTKLMDLAKDSLEVKREFIERLTDAGLYPYSRHYLQDIKKRRGEYWNNHFSTIGIIGMNEAMLNLISHDIASSKGNKLAQEILEFMRNKMIKYQKETDNMYNLEATPGEGTTYRLAKADQAKYPDMIFANQEAVKQEKAEPYYTNSSHLPVGYTEDIFEALDLQDSLQSKYTGGTVLHGFLGEKIDDLEVVKNLVKKIANNYTLPYFTFTPTFSICPKHGYLAGEHHSCPKCTMVLDKSEVVLESV